MSFNLALIYLAPLLGLWGLFAVNAKRRERRAVQAKTDAEDAGLIEPASLHPIIAPGLCVGCGACVRACPEGEILGLVNGKAQLIEPSRCIGHGACAQSCPMQAISLVFGTERRGIDLPHVGPDFQTNVPGLYIAGELGGMGLIRNAIEQGRQAMDEIAKLGASRGGAPLDVLIVGAGPAGLSASLGAMKHGLRFKTVDQSTLGGTVAHFPRGKLVMTAPAELPLYGTVNLRETSKEELIAFWTDVVGKTGLAINDDERVDAITREGNAFRVSTSRTEYLTNAVLLAIGRRGTPRKLGVPGEESEKVVYRLIDPEQYRGRRVLVVGGGDSALEAAASIAEEPGTDVTISYRGDGFSRAKLKNRDRVSKLQDAGKLRVMLSSNVREIGATEVWIEDPEGAHRLENDFVIVCAGGILPTAFLKSIGIEVETKYGTA